MAGPYTDAGIKVKYNCNLRSSVRARQSINAFSGFKINFMRYFNMERITGKKHLNSKCRFKVVLDQSWTPLIFPIEKCENCIFVTFKSTITK